MVNFIYQVFINLVNLISPLLCFVSEKFRIREKNWKKVLESQIHLLSNSDDEKLRIWVHSSSMGEFEQAKPIIELLKKKFNNIFITASFFSPSGYENQKNYRPADVKLYLPLDTRKNVSYFLSLIKPNLAIFIRYEIWLNLLIHLKRSGIPAFLVSATKPRGFNLLTKEYYKISFSKFTKIYPSSEQDFKFFESLKINVPLEKITDTRFDRVWIRINEKKEKILSKEELGSDFVLVAGSIWKEDAKLILSRISFIKNFYSLKIVYVPHEPTTSLINLIKRYDPQTILLSDILNNLSIIKDQSENIIVDKVGFLLDLYSIADAVFVGGGFGKGVHSVVEPAGYFLPISCGPRISNSQEAQFMSENGIIRIVRNTTDFLDWLSRVRYNKDYYKSITEKTKEYFMQRLGSTEKVVNEIISIGNLFRANNL
ncbi:MAG: 3-deoxy-D-manno-octulosonic acid transferase [Ignavibacteria bacterium]|nr:3-deoxy-D-manno-octulosonic acid transferase [Ignavibacteria bacterium]